MGSALEPVLAGNFVAELETRLIPTVMVTFLIGEGM